MQIVTRIFAAVLSALALTGAFVAPAAAQTLKMMICLLGAFQSYRRSRSYACGYSI